jgi:VWFA-related protein
MTPGRKFLAGLLGFGLWLGQAAAQQKLPDAPEPTQSAGSQQQPVPNAPSASKPAEQFPPPVVVGPVSPPSPGVPPANPIPATKPPQPEITEVPPGQAPMPGSPRDDLFKLSVNTNFVVVPVTVKDASGHLVEGLTLNDFTVLEDDKPQKVTFFTSDPFPLSAAVVLDLGVPEVAFQKVKNTLSALIGAFGQFDEVSVYTYSHTVAKVQDFTAVNDRLSASMARIKRQKAQEGGVPVVGGPFGSGPTVNGRPIDPGTPPVPTVTRESHVLNDAILEAALDLSHRRPDRRKILFVISDGREYNSDASYSEVLKVLLSHQVAVYAIGIGQAALPVYSQLDKLHVPGFGYADVLPKYAAATGGEVFNEFSQSALERAYSRITEDARNQYTLGYYTRSTPSTAYRSIEVRIDRPELKVDARQGYYPLPPARETP